MRADGIRIKKMDPMEKIASYVMNKRTDAMNMTTINIPIDPIQEYINKKRKDGISISHMAVIIAAYLRTVAEYPMLNRFVVNCKPYARNEFAVAMVVLKAGKTDNGTMSKMYFDLGNTIIDVNDIINKYVDENRNAPDNNGTEKLMKMVLAIPGLLPVIVKLIKFMDKHGLCPKALIDMMPFHSSLAITNLASIRTNHIYHHIYEFGTTSVFMSMGNTREVARRKDGEIIFEKCMPIGVVMDERIAPGSYFATAFRRFKKHLKNPAVLEQPPEIINEDPDIPEKYKKYK